MDVEIKENELKMRKDMQQDAMEMFEAAGLKTCKAGMLSMPRVWVFMKWVRQEWVEIQKPRYLTATTKYGTPPMCLSLTALA